MALAKGAAAVDLRKVMGKRVVDMYRKLCRSVPKVLVMYNLEQTPAEARHMVLLHFRKNSHITDPRIMEMFLARAEMEYEETINQWKQKGHLMAILQPEASAPDPWYDEEEFFRRFLDGTLDEEVVWAGYDAKKLRERAARVSAAAAASGEGSRGSEGARIQALLAKLAASSKTSAAASKMQ